MGLFGPRLPIDRDELEFQLATFKWLIKEFGPVPARAPARPTQEDFPLNGARGEAAVRAIFESVRARIGIAHWPCELVVGTADRPTDAGNAHLLKHQGKNAPCGTFQIVEGPEGKQGRITYNPGMARDLEGLAATFAHEFGHYLMATAKGIPPGGWELHEFHTDLAAVYLGFGIFMANHAKEFAHFSTSGGQGWRSSLRGYLSEQALVTATAIAQRLAGREPAEAAPFLKAYLRTELKNADKALAKLCPDLAGAVAAIDLEDYGSA